MGLFDWLKSNKKDTATVSGTLEYIPGSPTLSQDTAITLDNGQLTKRLYVQPSDRAASDHSNIPIYTGNPFRAMRGVNTELGV